MLVQPTQESLGKQSLESITVTPYDVIQKLISGGHNKDDILNSYSLPEVRIFYEKVMRAERHQQASFIEAITGGIGLSFGGAKDMMPILKKLRE